MPECIGFSPGLVYGVQCVVVIGCVLVFLGSLLNRNLNPEERLVGIILPIIVFALMYYLSVHAFAGVGTVSNLPAGCDSAIFLGE